MAMNVGILAFLIRAHVRLMYLFTLRARAPTPTEHDRISCCGFGSSSINRKLSIKFTIFFFLWKIMDFWWP